MPTTLWSQDNFTKGELSPYMYARATATQYYNGLKTAQNVLCYPQGAAGKRFGTLFNSELSGFTAYNQIYFQTFQYLNECVYQILFKPLAIDIFLEGLLVATVVTTLDATSVWDLDYTVIDNRFRVSGQGFKPKDLVRAPNAGATVTAISPNSFSTTPATPYTADRVYPVRFTVAGGTIMQTTPQIKVGVTYFVYAQSTTTAVLFSTSQEAKEFDLANAYAITGTGTGTTTVIVQNTWTFPDVTYINRPVKDFNGGYDTYTFTPSAMSGAAVTLTSSTAIFTDAYIGGAYFGGGGIGRITAVGSASPITTCTIAVQQSFDSTNPISGALSVLTEPAWSDARGWPQKCSSYQNRAIFANSDSLPNGFWASAVNDYSDFNDIQNDDDDAISWYPTSDDVNYIKFIVPYRSVTVHTNTGVYSSPLSFEPAITPKSFSLQLQDSTPAERLQPRAIDNQIIVVSGNDVHTFQWDGLNNAYASGIVSLECEQVIRNPVDEAAYVDLTRAGSRYVFIINENGSMAIYQTLVAQDVSGWTPNIVEQSYGNAYFRQTATSPTGRGWFVIERQIAVAVAGTALSAYTPTPPVTGSIIFTAVAHGMTIGIVTAVKFSTTGTLLTSTPQIVAGDYYWAVAIDANTFQVYQSFVDAEAAENPITVNLVPINNTVTPWPLVTKFYLEELTFDTRLDCATKYVGAATSTITGQSRFNAQNVKMVGDGFGFSTEGNNSEITFEAHGEAVQVTEAYIGFPINMIIEPMPLAQPQGQSTKSTTLTEPKHIRFVRFMFNNTIGGTINGIPIALNRFNQTNIGEPPVPARGYIELSIMKGWDDFDNPTFTILHDEPFNIELLGVFYTVDL